MNRLSLFSCLSLCCVVVFLGCGEPAEPVGTVTGKVTFNGAPVEEGVVNFFSQATNTGGSGELGSGGSYSAPAGQKGLPLGEYEVYVVPPTVVLSDTAESPGGEGYKEVDNIPQKYRSSGTSELKVTVAEGPNSFDIQMTDDK